jgi:predicted ester cyclase
MNSLKILKESLNAFEKGDSETLSNQLHDDFQLIGPAPKAVGKTEFLEMARSMKAGIPDWDFDTTDLVENGDQITGCFHVTGKHSGTLDLSFLGLPSQPATDIKIKQPEERFKATIRDTKLYRMELETVEGGGFDGLLRQIGVGIPAHA